MKKIISFSFSIAFMLNVNAQSTDTTCLKTRWISLKNTSQNNLIFKNLYSSNTIFNELTELINNGSISVYKEIEGYQNRSNYSNLETDTSAKLNDNSFQYRLNIPSAIPIANSYGEDSIIKVNGVNQYVYPVAKVITFNLAEVSEIRIRENRENKNEFVPNGIGFVTTTDGLEKEIFWIYFENLTNRITKKENINWCNSIKNKQYSGFQYFQIPCSDKLSIYK